MTRRRVAEAVAVSCLSVLVLLSIGARADAVTAPDSIDHEEVKRRYFTDLPLVTQDAEEVRFYSDLLKDKVVVINFIFTNCPGVCPLHSAKLAELQQRLGGLMEEKVRFISISVDPERDTPQRLKKFAKRFNAGSGWTFLTGDKRNLDVVTKKLGQYNVQVEAHSPIFIMGNVRTADWVKMKPTASAKALAAEVERLLAADVRGN
ncbi:MAG: SCO family protein [Candidatus Binatia bacterium]